MQVRPGAIDGVWEFTPVLRPDDRGVFLESFRSDVFADAVGHRLDLAQMNVSVSRRGTVRGVHFADVPPGQAKYVQCLSGRILDVVGHIASTLSACGEKLARGDVIICGSVVAPIFLEPADSEVAFALSGLGEVSIRLAWT